MLLSKTLFKKTENKINKSEEIGSRVKRRFSTFLVGASRFCFYCKSKIHKRNKNKIKWKSLSTLTNVFAPIYCLFLSDFITLEDADAKNAVFLTFDRTVIEFNLFHGIIFLSMPNHLQNELAYCAMVSVHQITVNAIHTAATLLLPNGVLRYITDFLHQTEQMCVTAKCRGKKEKGNNNKKTFHWDEENTKNTQRAKLSAVRRKCSEILTLTAAPLTCGSGTKAAGAQKSKTERLHKLGS